MIRGLGLGVDELARSTGIRRMLTAFVGLILLTLSIALSYLHFDLITDPISVARLTLRNPIVRQGELVFYAIEFDRYKICKTSLDRFILHYEAGGVVATVYRDESPGVLSLGHNRRTASITTAGLPPGEYTLKIFIINFCTLATRISEYNDGHFTVVP